MIGRIYHTRRRVSRSSPGVLACVRSMLLSVEMRTRIIHTQTASDQCGYVHVRPVSKKQAINQSKIRY